MPSDSHPVWVGITVRHSDGSEVTLEAAGEDLDLDETEFADGDFEWPSGRTLGVEDLYRVVVASRRWTVRESAAVSAALQDRASGDGE